MVVLNRARFFLYILVALQTDWITLTFTALFSKFVYLAQREASAFAAGFVNVEASFRPKQTDLLKKAVNAYVTCILIETHALVVTYTTIYIILALMFY